MAVSPVTVNETVAVTPLPLCKLTPSTLRDWLASNKSGTGEERE